MISFRLVRDKYGDLCILQVQAQTGEWFSVKTFKDCSDARNFFKALSALGGLCEYAE